MTTTTTATPATTTAGRKPAKKQPFHAKKARKPAGSRHESSKVKQGPAKALSGDAAARAMHGQLTQLPVAFTPDSRMFLSGNDREVRFYSVATGQAIRSVPKWPQDSHRKPLTAALISEASPHQLITSSLDGRVKVWNYEEQTLEKTFVFGEPVYGICLCPKRPNEMLVLTVNQKTGESSVHMRVLDKSPKKQDAILTKLSTPCRMAWSSDGTTLALVYERQLHIGSIGKDGSVQLKRQERGPSNEQMLSTSFHWHAFAVRTIEFTSDGIHMLSGGTEGVMVIWHMRSGTKKFLPHLGADISSIAVSPDQNLYAIAQQDNAIRVVNALDLTMKQIVQGLKIGSSAAHRLLSGSMAVEPHTGHLVLNGSAGSLQFYNAITNRHIRDLEVTPVGYVARASRRQSSALLESAPTRRNICEPVIDHVTFTSDGKWMVTADSRRGTKEASEQFLKFWALDPKKQSYHLRTRVDAPHQDKITSITATVRNGIPLVVTTSRDGRWKAWGLQADNKTKYWICVSSCDYRGMRARWSAFSDDGSLLAVAFNDIITLWDPWYATLKRVFAYSISQRPIQQLAFVPGTAYLVAYTDQHLYVWNVLTCSVHWCVQMKVQQLALDPNSPQFTVIAAEGARQGKYLLTFDPAQPIPKMMQPFVGQSVIYAGMPSTGAATASPLVVLDKHNQLRVHAGEVRKEQLPSESEAMEGVEGPAAANLFSNLFGKTSEPSSSSSMAPSVDAGQEAATLAASAAAAANVENSDECWSLPAHVMPDVHTLYTHFMAGLLTTPDMRAADQQGKETVAPTLDEPMTTTFMVVQSDDAVPLQPSQAPNEQPAVQDKPMLDMLATLFHSQLNAPST
ncbi:WD40-repeat-containing domain protein [Syncephalis pseudoplumigaleata]|uniref:WD40-repeat-containing domain protein n=1 Tax=Syncephalis pseudoplumigaleata TaxID=1712513 RepID=A0A4P9Z5P7_9FUNG|nr:WD40-repeat-containing domain protein [Syncephalis pseudoplumigaleata]|eukprot:RKP27953.1 WD40-repeat-containing domain protein [Syncephalis pseudoplumigaleata]